MNYYERHLGDYARDAGHLTMLEHGAYTLLLDRYYSTELPIPADQAYRVARARSRDERAAVDAVLAEFFTLQDGVWMNGRADEEIAKAQARIKAAKENGRRGGRPKSNPPDSQQKPAGFSPGSDPQTQQKAHQTPDTNHQTGKEGKAPRAPAALAHPCPAGVADQVWADWLALRKSKKAPVTPTVIAAAEREAAKAGLSLEQFLQVWCFRGSQGLQADWIKPDEIRAVRQSPGAEPAWRAEQRSRVQQAVPGIAARPAGSQPTVIDVEAHHVPSALLG